MDDEIDQFCRGLDRMDETDRTRVLFGALERLLGCAVTEGTHVKRHLVSRSVNFAEQVTAQLLQELAHRVSQTAESSGLPDLIAQTAAATGEEIKRLKAAEATLEEREAQKHALEGRIRNHEAKREARAQVSLRLADIEADIGRLQTECATLASEMTSLRRDSEDGAARRLQTAIDAFNDSQASFVTTIAGIEKLLERLLKLISLQLDDDTEIVLRIDAMPDYGITSVLLLLNEVTRSRAGIKMLEKNIADIVSRSESMRIGGGT